MTISPTAGRGYAGDDGAAVEKFRRRYIVGLGLAVAGTIAALAACFFPVAADEDFRLATDNWRVALPIFVAVAAGAAAILFIVRRTDPVAMGVLAGVGLITAAYFVFWVLNTRQFGDDPGVGTYLGLGGGVLMTVGATVLVRLQAATGVPASERMSAVPGARADHAGLAGAPAESPQRGFAQRYVEEPIAAPRPAEEEPPAPELTEEQPPAGWYPDPAGHARVRYWTGTSWTENTQD